MDRSFVGAELKDHQSRSRAMGSNRNEPLVPPRSKVGAFTFTGKATAVAAADSKVAATPARSKTGRRPLMDVTNSVRDAGTSVQPLQKVPLDVCVDPTTLPSKRKSTPTNSSVPPLKKSTSVAKAVTPPTTTIGKRLASTPGSTITKFNLRSNMAYDHDSDTKRLLAAAGGGFSRGSGGGVSPPSKLSSLRKKILEKVSGKPKSTAAKEKDERRLSMILRSEKELLEKNKAIEAKMERLQEQCYRKESEMESVRNVGKMLGKLCVSQAEELKAIKGAFPSTLREAAELRQLCHHQEKELRDARTIVPSLQEQVKLLTTQLEVLAGDIEKVKADRIARQGINNGIGLPTLQVQQPATMQDVEASPMTKGEGSNLLAGANLETIMYKLNLSEDMDLSTLEQKCSRAFENMGFIGD